MNDHWLFAIFTIIMLGGVGIVAVQCRILKIWLKLAERLETHIEEHAADKADKRAEVTSHPELPLR